MLHTILVTVTLTSTLNTWKNRIPNISFTLFEVTISNFVSGCILMLRFWANVTLTSDLSCNKNHILCISSLLYDIEFSNYLLAMVCHQLFLGLCDLDLWLQF